MIIVFILNFFSNCYDYCQFLVAAVFRAGLFWSWEGQTSILQASWNLNGRRCKRSGYAYEAKDLKGDQIFSGGASCLTTSCSVAVQNAIVEAAVKATNLGFSQILFLTNCKRTTQVCNGTSQTKLAGVFHDDRLTLPNAKGFSLWHSFCS